MGAPTHETVVRNLIADAVVDSIDAGTADANGELVFLTAADLEVAAAAFANPAFGAAAAGIATANAIGQATNGTGSTYTVAKFLIRDRDNVTKLSGSVTATSGGGVLEISSVSIANGEKIDTSSMTYTAAS